jgi:RND family efflux transporter MFP subunit
VTSFAAALRRSVVLPTSWRRSTVQLAIESSDPMRFVDKRCGAILLTLLLAACGDSGSNQAAAPPPPPVTVAKPVIKEIVEYDEFTGRFDAAAWVEVRARVGGYLESVEFTDGAIVKEGDLLFIIDRRPFQATLAQADATLASARARLEFARQELERVERLTRSGNAPERQLDERRQQFLSAQAEVNGAQGALTQARLDLGFTEIRAPIAGRVSRKLVPEGNLVRANETMLTTIVALDPIHFYFDVDERSYLAYVRRSQSGEREGNGHPIKVALTDEREPTHDGQLDFTDNRLDAATGTMRVRALLENKKHLMMPGMFGRIAIPGSGRYRAVLVPDEAIGADLDRRFVYVVADDGTVSQKVVRPGPRQDGYRIVRTGLNGDETIIVNGMQRARFGKITPQPTTLPPVREASAAGRPSGSPSSSSTVRSSRRCCRSSSSSSG